MKINGVQVKDAKRKHARNRNGGQDEVVPDDPH